MSSRWDASKHIHFAGLDRSTSKFNLRSGSSCQVNWPDLMNYSGRSCCISVAASWKDKYSDTLMALTLLCQEVIDATVFVTCDSVIYDVIWPVLGSSASSCTWSTDEVHLNCRGFITNIDKQGARFTTGNTCSNWVVTRPPEQGHSTAKDHRNHLQTLLKKAKKWAKAKK